MAIRDIYNSKRFWTQDTSKQQRDLVRIRNAQQTFIIVDNGLFTIPS